MRSNIKSTIIGFALGLGVAAVGAQAAVQASEHEHTTPPVQQTAPEAMRSMQGMKDMDAMMADPAMRQKMMANMAQCRDMMSMMMEHMQQAGKMGHKTPDPRKH